VVPFLGLLARGACTGRAHSLLAKAGVDAGPDASGLRPRDWDGSFHVLWVRQGASISSPARSIIPPPITRACSGLQRLCSLPSDVFLVELPHASMRLREDVPSTEEAVQAMTQMLRDHGHPSGVFLGHSLGSVYVSWMCRFAPAVVAGTAFVEPIVFMLYLKTVTRNFLYDEYGGGIGYMIRSELFLNHALRRHFWWHLNVLWVRLPCRDGLLASVHCR
jgi:hypothetical protein